LVKFVNVVGKTESLWTLDFLLNYLDDSLPLILKNSHAKINRCVLSN